MLKKPTATSYQVDLEKQRIKELIEFERFCRDNAQWVEMKKCFSKNSKVSISWYEGTGFGFVEASENMEGRAPHKLHNTLVWVNGDRAVAIVMATIQKRLKIQNVLCELNSDAKLIYSLKKEAEEWLINGLTAVYEQDSINTVVPGGKLEISKSMLEQFRSSYACLSYALTQMGYVVNNDLPGIDRDDLVANIYKEMDDWLKWNN
ncbi:hypothetical protein [Fulvivirga ligni]|uniref:hypothetical protein n=1 Tax=Fulvivirga ligni TaxID=2904246 RepID=UPI001F1E6FE6|nr:hypothetical protein [Fulvivirga ligni]UII19653.1 hypothetical protein LVD16_17575 [Fulvivirga ligni]